MQKHSAWVSERVAQISISAIKEMAIRSARIPDAVSLTWGVPSFRTPEHIRRAITAALGQDADIGKYSLPDGLPQLREQVARTHFEATGITVDPDRNVLITAGNMEGLNGLFRTLLEPGDEVVLTDPGFASHLQQIRLCGGRPVFWPMDEARQWRLDLDRLPGLITERTKAIVLVSPSNPTGKIFTETELRQVAKIAQDKNLLVLLDDPYSRFTYENRDLYFNLASVEAFTDNIAYLFTFSKAYAMSGWRIGYMIVPEEIKRQVLKVHDATMICAPRISQVGALAALRETPLHLPEFERALAARRELICARLDALPHLFSYQKPEGAYYVFPRIVTAHEDARAFAMDVLDRAHVALTPGSAFGPSGEHHVRMAYCVEESVIETAFDRLAALFPA